MKIKHLTSQTTRTSNRWFVAHVWSVMSIDMAEEYPEKIKLYDHVPNSGIVHMPGRRFPAVAIQQGNKRTTSLQYTL